MELSVNHTNKTVNMLENSNVTFEINNDYVHIIEYAEGKPRIAMTIDTNLIIKIYQTELKTGRYNGNV